MIFQDPVTAIERNIKGFKVECGETSDDAPFYPCSVASFMERLDIVPSLT